MAEFKPITTQAEFDLAIQERLDRERKKFADYEDLKGKARELDELKGRNYEGTITALQKQLEEANGKLAGLDELTKRAESAERALSKTKIAGEYRIPLELSERITGESEADMRKDAERLARFVVSGTPPMASSEPVGKGSGSNTDAALAALSGQLFGG